MQASGGNRGGRFNDLFKAARGPRLRTDNTRSSWRTAGWTRGGTVIFGQKRAVQGPKPPQNRREIMKEITRKVLAEERAAARKDRKTLPPAPSPARTQERPAPRDQSRERPAAREQSRERPAARDQSRERPASREQSPPQAAPAAAPSRGPAPEVSAQRRKPAKDPAADARTLIRPRRTAKTTTRLALRVVKGLHAGALTPLTAAGVLMIGSADDCDVILADPGVKSHHCLLSIQDGKVAVRAIDGAVKLGDQEHAPGSAASLELETAVGLGEAGFEVTANPQAAQKDAVPPEETQANAPSGFIPQQLRGGWRWTANMFRGRAWAAGAAAGGLVALAALTLTLVLTPRPRTMWVAAPVSAPPQAPAASTPERIVQDVTEVLRLQGIAGLVTYTGEGTVTVSGHLGDPHALEQAIQSRAMQEIAGLQRVVEVNADHPGATTGTSADRVRIISAVAGKDPFVVTADGSRYYAGAQLPQGGTLAGVEGDEILIERNGKTERLKLSDVESGATGGTTDKSGPTQRP